MDYIEKGCIFITENGKQYESGGAYVDDHFAIGYCSFEDDGAPGKITDWHGKTLSSKVKITASWRIRSFWNSHMYQVKATIGGVQYTGRTLGNGMIWKGKRLADQSEVL